MSGSSKKEIDVILQDQTSPPVLFFFAKAKAAPAILADSVSIDDLTMTVVDSTNLAIGDYVGVFPIALEGRFYFATILNKAGNNITLDTPFDFAYQPGSIVLPTTRDLNVLGTPASPQVFVVESGGVTSPISIDITRLIITMLDGSSMDDGMFGGISSLVNGIVLRRVNGEVRNYFNVKNNGEIANLAYDTNYVDKAPSGQYGFRSRMTFAGQNKMGVALRLDPGDRLELIIQDDLTDLIKFRVIAEGHII